MSSIAIRVESLGKSYNIGHLADRERNSNLRDVIAEGLKRIGKTALNRSSSKGVEPGSRNTEQFWALRRVDFEIEKGEIVGVIGRNGAGKSTLLKILSRITEPTEGKVTIGGRLASLLEVGTGFHAELTGRENIFLNGSILGMSRSEVQRKFDEIVDFAGVERFLDTPVKRYSSGMYVRLAFSVAAHLEPEILIIDEVLAVGDSEFQSKCLGKMRTVASSGRTVILVSHNTAAINVLCKRLLLLDAGALVADGRTRDVLDQYSKSAEGGIVDVKGNRTGVYVSSVRKVTTHVSAKSGGLTLLLTVRIFSSDRRNVDVNIRVRDPDGFPIMYAALGNNRLESPVSLASGETAVSVEVDISNLVVGNYKVSVDVLTPFVEWLDRVEDIASFTVEPHHWTSMVQPTRQEWGVGQVQVAMKLLSVQPDKG